jgi:antagonist of KipI
MSVSIIKPGLLTTLQDAGRFGYRSTGITPGGVMDIFAATMANRLVMNPAAAAVMEIHFPGPELRFEQDMLVGVTGAEFDMRINDHAASNWQSHFVKAGSILRFAIPKKGCRAYLSGQGGWQADAWLGSYSTHTLVQEGGFHGRPLQKGDVVKWVPGAITDAEVYEASISTDWIAQVYGDDTIIDVIPGPEFDWLSKEQKELLTYAHTHFQVSPQSNRMGYRLQGPPLLLANQPELLSSAVAFGTVQLTPNGQCIILMADHQTTGGYPRILSVAAEQLPKLAQVAPGGLIQFRLISPEEAEENLISLQRLIR